MPRMCSQKFLYLVFILVCPVSFTAAQSAKSFPSPESMLRDAKHKEPKSGVQIGPGNTITIQSGVGTPTTINVLSFGKNGALLAAGKDFGRVVVWDVANKKSYGWKLIDVERANPVPDDGEFSKEVEDMLERTRSNPNAIIYGTFYSYPVM